MPFAPEKRSWVKMAKGRGPYRRKVADVKGKNGTQITRRSRSSRLPHMWDKVFPFIIRAAQTCPNRLPTGLQASQAVTWFRNSRGEKLNMEQQKNSISRRQLFKAMAVTGVATVGAGLFGGCSSSRNASSQSVSSTTAQSAGVSSSASASAPASASAASSSAVSEASESTGSSGSAGAAGATLVAVFSWSGNTLAVADRVANDLNAELFRIEPATPYTTDYNEMLQIAQDEQAAGTMPEIAAKVQDWDKYSTIYLGFPTWWGHLPQIVKSFLAEHDCSGKVVYPFNTHAGSGFASCLSDLASACPGADIREGLSMPGDSVASSMDQVDAWVASNA